MVGNANMKVQILNRYSISCDLDSFAGLFEQQYEQQIYISLPRYNKIKYGKEWNYANYITFYTQVLFSRFVSP